MSSIAPWSAKERVLMLYFNTILGATLSPKKAGRSNPRCWASETVVSLNLTIPLGALFGRFLPVLSVQKLLYRLLDPSYEREIHIARPPVGYSVTVFLELDCR